MANLIQIILGAMLAAFGAYAALAGSVGMVFGTPGLAPIRIARPIAAALALFGLAAYVIGTLVVAGRMVGPA